MTIHEHVVVAMAANIAYYKLICVDRIGLGVNYVNIRSPPIILMIAATRLLTINYMQSWVSDDFGEQHIK